ncbi:MAG: acyltransferase, partial [Rhodospirillales bacterium]|nr:acyltransferase [Rhodospirillales bacterium]
ARIARVWPGHMAAILFLFAIFWPFSLSLLHGPVLLRRLAATIAMLQAWSPVRATYWALNTQSWSISVEFAFYVAFPFLLPRLARRPLGGLAMILGVALAVATAIGAQWPNVDPVWLGYINPVINLPDFTLGIVLALWLRRAGPASGGFARASAIELAALALALAGNVLGGMLSSASSGGLPGWLSEYLSVATGVPFYALLIVALARYRGIVSRALSLRPIVYLGEISYTLYLFHQPMIRAHSGYPTWHSGWKGWVASLPIWDQYALLLGTTLALVIAVHHLIEQPARRRINALWRRHRTAVDPVPPPAIVGGVRQGDLP